MKQPGDYLTLELPIPAAAKRGRGRPRKDNALTDADRARRYRYRKILKRTLALQMEGMNNGQMSRLRYEAGRRDKNSLEYSVLCEMSRQRFLQSLASRA